MKSISKRIGLLTTGAAVLALEVFMPKAANAGGFTRTSNECINLGGSPKWEDSVKEYWCETRQQDRECRQTNPRYDSSGNRIRWYYDIKTGRCYRGECFLTTACVDHAGLADDCFELAVLRRFRDGVLAGMAGGADDIALYYRHAPAIVERIAGSGTAPRELARIYARYVLPSALAARFGFNAIARRIYTRMMRDLAARYGIALS